MIKIKGKASGKSRIADFCHSLRHICVLQLTAFVKQLFRNHGHALRYPDSPERAANILKCIACNRGDRTAFHLLRNDCIRRRAVPSEQRRLAVHDLIGKIFLRVIRGGRGHCLRRRCCRRCDGCLTACGDGSLGGCLRGCGNSSLGRRLRGCRCRSLGRRLRGCRRRSLGCRIDRRYSRCRDSGCPRHSFSSSDCCKANRRICQSGLRNLYPCIDRSRMHRGSGHHRRSKCSSSAAQLPCRAYVIQLHDSHLRFVFYLRIPGSLPVRFLPHSRHSIPESSSHPSGQYCRSD